jgi:hypothetical protein
VIKEFPNGLSPSEVPSFLIECDDGHGGKSGFIIVYRHMPWATAYLAVLLILLRRAAAWVNGNLDLLPAVRALHNGFAIGCPVAEREFIV